MSEHGIEPIFCSECQNEVKPANARLLQGHVLCKADLAKRSSLERLRARRLPQDLTRRGGATFRSLFTSLAALMFVVGLPFVWRVASVTFFGNQDATTVEAVRRAYLAPGVAMMFGSALVAVFGLLAGDIVDLLLDILDQLRRANRP
jgi:hypothetical protein